MTKKGVRVVVTGAQRRSVDVEAMVHVVIALGRELAERAAATNKQTVNESVNAEAAP